MTQARIPAQHLQLVKQPTGPLGPGLDISPVGLYVAGLAESARRPVLSCLRRAARMMGAPSTDDVRWEAMRFAHVELLKERMRKENLAPATINATVCALRGVAREAWRLGVMSADDYQRVRDVRNVRGSRVRAGRALSGDELARLIETCEGDESNAGARDLCLVALLAGGGLRRSEVVSLDASDYDARRHALKVRGKGDRERTVYFEDGGARRAIARWLRARGERTGPLLCPVDKTDQILRRRMSPQAVYKILSKRSKAAGLRHFSPHDLRRTYASELLDASGDLAAVRDLLGHASVETTAVYDRRGEDAKRRILRGFTLPFKVRRKRTPRKARKGRRRKFRRGEYK